MSEDNRLHRRVALRMAVQFRTSSLGEFVQRHAADISAGGMYVMTDRPIPVGTELTLQFTVAGHTVVDCVARVVRHGTDGMGLQFLNIPDAVKVDLEHMAAQYRLAS